VAAVAVAARLRRVEMADQAAEHQAPTLPELELLDRVLLDLVRMAEVVVLQRQQLLQMEPLVLLPVSLDHR
jgi:hypothetical protein